MQKEEKIWKRLEKSGCWRLAGSSCQLLNCARKPHCRDPNGAFLGAWARGRQTTRATRRAAMNHGECLPAAVQRWTALFASFRRVRGMQLSSQFLNVSSACACLGALARARHAHVCMIASAAQRSRHMHRYPFNRQFSRRRGSSRLSSSASHSLRSTTMRTTWPAAAAAAAAAASGGC